MRSINWFYYLAKGINTNYRHQEAKKLRQVYLINLNKKLTNHNILIRNKRK